MESYKKNILGKVPDKLTAKLLDYIDIDGLEAKNLSRKYEDFKSVIRIIGDIEDSERFRKDISAKTNHLVMLRIERLSQEFDTLENNIEIPENEEKITALENRIKQEIERYSEVPEINVKEIIKKFEKSRMDKTGYEGQILVDTMNSRQMKPYGVLDESRAKKMHEHVQKRINYLTHKREKIAENIDILGNKERLDDIDREIELVEDTFAKVVENKKYGEHHQARIDAEQEQLKKQQQEEEEAQRRKIAEEEDKAREKAQQEKAEAEMRLVKQIEQTISVGNQIPQDLINTYNLMHSNQKFYEDLVSRFKMDCNIEPLDSNGAASYIQSINENIKSVNIRVTEITDSSKVDVVSGIYDELSSMSKDKSVVIENNRELKSMFTQSFDMKIQQLIKEDKLKQLEQELESVKSEKVSFFGFLSGKKKLKEERLANIMLRKQLLYGEKYEFRNQTTLEDSLSNLYMHIWEQHGGKVPDDMVQFFDVIQTEDFSKICNNEEVKRMFVQKREQKESENLQTGAIVTESQNKKVSARAQARQYMEQNQKLQGKVNEVTLNKRQSDIEYVAYVPPANSVHVQKFNNLLKEVSQSVQVNQNHEQNRRIMDAQQNLR
ncbi:MAG: hypothetical protein J6J36_02550 [Clostridia bacterium]|nr:hypothetical protein [Clostridia bacterium]